MPLQWLPLIIACVAGIVWLVRLEGRINGHDTLFKERQRHSDDRLDAILARLVRIENKLDSLDYDQSAHRIGPSG